GNPRTGRGAEYEDELAPRLLVAAAGLAIAPAGERSSLQQAVRQVGQPEAESIRTRRRSGIAQHAADVRIEVGANVHRRGLPDPRSAAFGGERLALARGNPGQ